MAPPQAGDILVIPVYTSADEESLTEIKWQQRLSDKTAKFYLPRAKNQTRDNEDVLLYVQEAFFKDESSKDHISKIPGVKREGDNWVLPINDRFQYGQKNAAGDSRFVVLQNKDNAMFQHRFLITTIQGNAAAWAKTLAGNFGASELANNIHTMGNRFVGDKMKTF